MQPEIPPVQDGQTHYYSLKPKIVFWMVALPALPISLFLSVWATGFFGGFGFAILSAVFHLNFSFIYFLIFFVILFITINFLILFVAYNTAKKTEYRFYEDKIEYFEGFMARERKTMFYNRIVDISSREGIIEKKYGLGTIVLETPGLGRGSLIITGVENPERWYKWLSAKIKPGSATPYP
jgi:membrane protein YdbS with pleckstrin-like domain